MTSNRSALTFVQIIWGPQYIQNYLNYTLPSELAEDNLPYFANKNATYLILTRDEDAVSIKKHPLYKKLCEIIKVDFFLIDTILSQMSNPSISKYSIFSAFHQIAILLLINSKSSAVFIPADGIWGRGSLKRISEIHESGYLSIFLLGSRVTRDSFCQSIERFRAADGILTLSNRTLADITIKNLHPQMNSFFWNASAPSLYPSTFIWQMSDNTLLLRCFHLHPILVDNELLIKCRDSSVHRTIDCEIAKHIIPENKNIYIVEDSDEVMVATHSPCFENDLLLDPDAYPYTNTEELRRKLGNNDFKYCHRNFATKRIFIHSEELDITNSKSIIEESDTAIWNAINL